MSYTCTTLESKKDNYLKINDQATILNPSSMWRRDGGHISQKRCNGKIQTNKVFLTVIRDTETPLWLIPIGGPKLYHMQQLQTMIYLTKNKLANSAYRQQTLTQLTAYLHACVGSIPPNTWMKTIAKEWSSSWPGLTTTVVHKHLPKSPMTIMGHMNRIRKGIILSIKVTT